MNRIAAILLVGIVAAAVGCSLPNWRVFQKKVDGRDAEQPKEQTEGQRRAAAYIKAVTTPPVADPAKTVEDVHEVAAGLSASLGEPEHPVKAEDKDAVLKSLRAALQSKEEQLERWKAFGRRYAGTPLEDTGINLAGPAGLALLAGGIALCVAFPPVGYLLLRVLPILWGYFRRTTTAIGEFCRTEPDAGGKLAATLRAKMDEAHKRLVRKRAAKVRIPESVSNPPFPVPAAP